MKRRCNIEREKRLENTRERRERDEGRMSCFCMHYSGRMRGGNSAAARISAAAMYGSRRVGCSW